MTCAEDIIAELAPRYLHGKYLEERNKTGTKAPLLFTNANEKQVYDILEFTPLSENEIAGRSGLSICLAVSALTGLELLGKCVRIQGGYAKKMIF